MLGEINNRQCRNSCIGLTPDWLVLKFPATSGHNENDRRATVLLESTYRDIQFRNETNKDLRDNTFVINCIQSCHF